MPPSKEELIRLKQLEASAQTVLRELAARRALNPAVLSAALPHLQRAHYTALVEERVRTSILPHSKLVVLLTLFGTPINLPSGLPLTIRVIGGCV